MTATQGEPEGRTIILMATSLSTADLGDERHCIEHLIADGWRSAQINKFLEAAIDHARARRQARATVREAA